MIGTLLTCMALLAVDGDTIKCDGVNMRDMGSGKPFVSGYDAPETRNAQCQEELELGRAATTVMRKLLAGAEVWDSGKRDRYGRPLVWVRTADGRVIGDVLMAAGLAKRWTPDYRSDWCPGG